jgi:hypothetical protein
VVVLVAGAGVTTVDRVTVVVVAGAGVTATSCSQAPKALTLSAKSASLPMLIRFFMHPVRVLRHMRLQNYQERKTIGLSNQRKCRQR